MAPPEEASAPRRRFSILTNWFGKERTQSSETSQDDFLSIRSVDEREEVGARDDTTIYKRAPAEYDHPIWKLGWTDGRSYQPPSVSEKLLEAQARIEWSQKITDAKAQIGRSAQKIELLGREKKDIEMERDEIENQHREIGLKRSVHFQDFSKKQAWSYLLFGVVTLIADIPLSLRLVAAGFGVRTTMKVEGQILSADDILSFHFFEVIRHFWEPIVLALGIAFASIVIKYFFDIVVFRDRGVPESGRPPESDGSQPPAQDQSGRRNEKERAERDSRIPKLVSRVSWVAVLLFITTTVCLGIFRYQIQPQVDKYERETQRQEEKLRRIDEKYNEILPIYRDEKDAAKQARQQATELVDAEFVEIPPPEFSSRWGLPTFVLLTLLLPIATAICFAIGGKKLRNAKLFESLATKRSELHERLRSIAAETSQEEGELAASKATLDLADMPDAQESLLKSFRYLYLHGYERGSKNVPETTEAKIGSIYELGVKHLSKLLAQRVNTSR